MNFFKIFCLISFFLGSSGLFTNQTETSSSIYEQLDLFSQALAIVQRDHVETPSSKDLIYGALKGLMNALDPHSQFLTPKDYQEIQVETEGKFSGIGIEITIRDGFLTIVSALDGTPAFEAGIRPKDRIRRIDGQSTRNISLEKAVQLLRGEKGSFVTLHIDRDTQDPLLVFKIKRKIIHIESVQESKIFEPNIGYIRLSEFQERSADDIKLIIRDFETKGVQGIVLDLRNNPGGLLQASVDVVDLFVPKGELVVYIKGRRVNQNINFYAKNEVLTSLKLVVLVNEGSASAAEIVAGAIQDLQRGWIIGMTSFGKGSVQSVIPLKDGSAIKLTTAKYFTPKGVIIQGVGITPNIEVALSEEEISRWHQRMKNNKKPFWIDPQLQVAIRYLQDLPYDDVLNRGATPNGRQVALLDH